MLEPETDGHLLERETGRRELLSRGWLELWRDTVQLPDGNEATREFIRHPGAVAVVPLLDDGRIVLVRQHRYPVGKVLLELPAGKRDAGETTLQTAVRELAEETGFSAREWAYGGEIHNAPAYSSESIWIWFARGLVAGPRRPDVGEFVETALHGAEELESLELAGELPDVKTSIGLHWLAQWKSGRRMLDWRPA
ncbi:MAG: NUDIX hydrolase [Rubrivivax sp.]|jgi:ADP-ribose pyrophosphatase|nr:NUDIX hydrolase [Rubrivivax sp.]